VGTTNKTAALKRTLDPLSLQIAWAFYTLWNCAINRNPIIDVFNQ